MQCVTLLLCLALAAAENYDNKLTKLWSVSRASRDGSSVFNVTSASIVIQPSNYGNQPSRAAKLLTPYAFRPRAIPIPIRREEQVEKNVYYADDAKKYKSEMLFPGNYYSISKEKSNSTYEKFRPQAIPLIRNDEFQRRSLDVDEEPTMEKSDSDLEPAAQRRSIIGEMFGVEDDDDEDEEGEYEIEELEDGDKEYKGHIKKKRKTKLKPKKLKKYMLPLLLAYKLKYFALVPVMIGGLILLVGATGMAGFFFALFAAVMGLQKGGY